MIRATVANTKDATFCVELPNLQNQGMPTPAGTGFFVSPDGWFLTALHVVAAAIQSNDGALNDPSKWWLMKEGEGSFGAMCQHVSVGPIIPHLDIAFLKVDYEANKAKAWLSDQDSFPFIKPSVVMLEDGAPVYSFGYPLSSAKVHSFEGGFIGDSALCPRVTSAIVSSSIEQTKAVWTSDDPKLYVLDKALNYGNSGGPIVSSESGHVHAICTRFQPVFIPQVHMKQGNEVPMVMMPSLYGVVSRLDNPEISSLFTELGIEFVS